MRPPLREGCPERSRRVEPSARQVSQRQRMRMRIVIIGGTGFVGPHVARTLSAGGHQVTAFHRGHTSADLPADIRQLYGTREQLTQAREQFQALEPDVVLDMIPSSEQDARTLVQTFTGIAQRVVAISSGDVYRNYDGLRRKSMAPPDPIPLDENAPLRERLYPYREPATDLADENYHYEKILVERVVLNAPELPGTVLRLPAVYGPGDRQHRLFPYVQRMHDGRPAILLEHGRASWRWTRGYVENVARAIALAVVQEHATGLIY